MIERIVIETETPGDSRTMFRVRMDDLVLGKNLTAAQAHLIVGEVLDGSRCRVRQKSLQSNHNRPRAKTKRSRPFTGHADQDRNAWGGHFSPVNRGCRTGAKNTGTTMDSKVTALERAFQLARSGHMATVENIKKRLKQEGYDERAVADGGPSLTTQLRGLIRAAGINTQPAEKM
jgi:hypothetical protein